MVPNGQMSMKGYTMIIHNVESIEYDINQTIVYVHATHDSLKNIGEIYVCCSCIITLTKNDDTDQIDAIIE